MAKVFFTREITPEKVEKMYELAGKELTGKVAVKLHSGEKGNQNFLGPDFWRPVIEKVGGTVVECNTAYDGARDTTAKHRLLIKEHGWDRYFNVDLMDAEGQIWSLQFQTESRSTRISSERIWQIMIQCWYFPISRVIRWADTAVH